VTAAELPAGAQVLLSRARDALPGAPAWVGLAPGRINVIGEHTDTIGGLALPTGVDRWAVVRLRPRVDGRVHIQALDLDEDFAFEADQRPDPPEGWARTMAGAVVVCHEAFGLPAGGFDAVVTGDVPRGGGMSSSAALCVAWVNVLAAWVGRSLGTFDVARLAQRVEHDWTGVPCGLLDQISSQGSQAGRLLRVDFRGPQLRAVPAPMPGHAWLVLDTGVRRALASSAYGQRVREVAAALQRVQARRPGVHFRDLRPGDFQRGDLLDRRLRHGMFENERVDAVLRLMGEGDLFSVGAVLGQSHVSLRDDLEVSCPELDSLVDAATSQTGCLGARMMGGGFGGCVLALVEDAAASAVAAGAREDHAQRFADTTSAAVVRGVDGARGWRA
jgi:galactokinase